MEKRGNGRDTLQTKNELLVLGIIIAGSRYRNGVSITEIAKIAGIGRSTAHNAVTRGIAAGCVYKMSYKAIFNSGCANRALVAKAKKEYKAHKARVYHQMSLFQTIGEE